MALHTSLRGKVALALANRMHARPVERLVTAAMDAIASGMSPQAAVDHVWETHTERVDLRTVLYLAGASDDIAADMAAQFPVDRTLPQIGH